MKLLHWDELIPEAQIYMLKKQYEAHHRYDKTPFLKTITASEFSGGFNWCSYDSEIMLDVIFGNYRKVIKCSMYLFLYKYIK